MLKCFQAGRANPPPSKGVVLVDGVSESNGQGTPPGDLAEQAKMKGIGRNRRTRFSLYRHLQRHTMQHSDSADSVDSTGSFACWGGGGLRVASCLTGVSVSVQAAVRC